MDLTIFDIISQWEPFDEGETEQFLFTFRLPFKPSYEFDIVIDAASSFEATMNIDKEYGAGAFEPLKIFRACIISFNLK